MSKQNLYQFAGIDDLAEFYRLRYASGEILDANYFDAVNRFDIRWSRTMWIYDNVRRGSSVLDLGCGAGVLALLKRKNVTLTGIDIWILFKIFIIMPVTALFFWWQSRVLQKYRLPEPISETVPRSDAIS